MQRKVQRSDAEWQRVLTPEQFRVARQKGTEKPFTGAYWDHHDGGVYQCVCCNAELFRAEDKFDSGCGWPSFFAPSDAAAIEEQPDRSHAMLRTEVLCIACGAHLGHLFDDGPTPAGARYCINSASLRHVGPPKGFRSA